ncbi:TolC family protein [Desulfobacula sp.]|uniref:TolC family protein n=1 Tax=Desulfobacula sp. TaxID=2593537 RepID=UPI00260FF787|nr:TolC family protein [Desulfobacula sp.]
MKNFKQVSVIILMLCLGIAMNPGAKPVFAQNRNGGAFDFASRSNTVFGLGSRISHEGIEMLLPFRQNGKLRLALIDCIDIALERNLDIHLIEESLAQADADITRAWSAMLPFMGAEANYTKLDEELAFGLGPVSMTFMDRDIYKAGIVLRQPVFTGGRLNAGRKAARYARDARIEDKKSIEEEIVFQVTRVYRTAQVAEAFHNVAVEAVNLLEQHEHDVFILVREGVNPEVDLLRTKTDLANAKKNLNASANAFDIALSGLKNLMVIDLEEPIFLTQRLGHPPKPAGDLSKFTSRAIKERSELSSLKYQISVAEQGLIAAKGKYLPTIALEGRYDYIKGDIREMDGDYHWTFGIGAEVPLWNWGKTRADIIKARSGVNQIKIKYKKIEEQICLEVRKAFLNLENAEKNITASEAALKTSGEAYRMEKARYQAGEGTNTNVLNAQTALSRAEANNAQALFEYNVALAALDRATGVNIKKNDLKQKEQTK